MTSGSGDGSASAQVREQIVKAARNCFLRYGTAKTSMADVARDAGVSRGPVKRNITHPAAHAEAGISYK
jgi:AcrR family transcriptional regulator